MKSRLWAAAWFLGAFSLYLSLMYGSYEVADGGEFMALGATLGVAHPPGYAFVSFFLRILAIIPAGGPEFRMNLLGPLSGALAISLVWSLMRRLTGLPLSFAVTLFAATHPAFLPEAMGAKGGVYFLNVCLATGICLAIIRAPLHLLLESLFLVGLALSLHLLLGILVAFLSLSCRFPLAPLSLSSRSTPGPGLASGTTRANEWIIAVVMMIIPASVMMATPIRSSAVPRLCWGDLHSLREIAALWEWWALWAPHVSSLAPFSDWPRYKTVLLMASMALIGNLAGLRNRKHRDCHLFIGTLAVISTMGFAAKEHYRDHLQVILVLLPAFSAGMAGFSSWLERIRGGRGTVAIAAILLSAFSLLNMAALCAADRSRFYVLDDYAKNIRDIIGKRKAVLIWLGDYDYDAVRYRQLAYGELPGVVQVHGSILMIKSYGDHLARLQAEFPHFRVPGSTLRRAIPGSANELDGLLADIARANAPHCAVYFQSCFSMEEGAWPKLCGLPHRVIGPLLLLKPGSGPSRDVLSRVRNRGIYSIAGTDTWSRLLLKELAFHTRAGATEMKPQHKRRPGP